MMSIRLIEVGPGNSPLVTLGAIIGLRRSRHGSMKTGGLQTGWSFEKGWKR
jgi:hypothetical protein